MSSAVENDRGSPQVNAAAGETNNLSMSIDFLVLF
jgi:hypothetical protein